MVVVPPCKFGDLLMTVRAESLLLFPEHEQLPFSLNVPSIFTPKRFSRVHFPCGVEGICSSLELDVPLDWRLCYSEEPNGFQHAFSPDHDA